MPKSKEQELVIIERITSNDARVVAELHAASWKTAYRGILSDAYLDERADSERAEYWNARLASHDERSFGFIARYEGEAVGFAFVVLDDDPVHGNLLDNLHVLPSYRGKGLGKALMSAVAGELIAREAGPSLFLWVYEDNHDARAFYDRMNGVAMDRTMVTTLDNRSAWQWRYVWRDAAQLHRAQITL